MSSKKNLIKTFFYKIYINFSNSKALDNSMIIVIYVRFEYITISYGISHRVFITLCNNSHHIVANCCLGKKVFSDGPTTFVIVAITNEHLSAFIINSVTDAVADVQWLICDV